MTELLLYPLNENRFQLDFKGFFNTKKKNPAKQHLAYLDNVNKFIKLNYNCPDSEKQGTGPGSCGGSKPNNDKKELQPLNTKTETFNNFKYEMDAFFKIPAQIADSKLIQYNQNISKHPENIRLEGMRLIHRTGSNNYQKEAREQIISEITNNTQLGKYLNDKIMAETKAFEENPVRLYRSGKYKNSIIESFTSNPDSAFTTNFDDVPPGNDFHKDYDELKTDGWKVLSGVLQSARYPEEYEVTLINIDELNKYRNKQKQNSAYLEDVSDFIKLNYKCKAGTVDDSNKCEPDSDSESSSSNNNHIESYSKILQSKVPEKFSNQVYLVRMGSEKEDRHNITGNVFVGNNINTLIKKALESSKESGNLIIGRCSQDAFDNKDLDKISKNDFSVTSRYLGQIFSPVDVVIDTATSDTIYKRSVDDLEKEKGLFANEESKLNIIEQNDALDSYRNFGYQSINNVLRKNYITDSKDKKNVLDPTPVYPKEVVEKALKSASLISDAMEPLNKQKKLYRADGGAVTTNLFPKIGLDVELTSYFEKLYNKPGQYPEAEDVLNNVIKPPSGRSWDEYFTEKLKGIEFTDPAFMSTSRSERGTYDSLNTHTDLSPYGITGLLEINVPKGIRAVDIQERLGVGEGRYKKEKEVLLDKNTSYKINSVKLSYHDNGILARINVDAIQKDPMIKTNSRIAVIYIKEHENVLLEDVTNFIKLNYKCPKGTVDDSNKCNPEEQEKSNTSDSKSASETFIGFKADHDFSSPQDVETNKRIQASLDKAAEPLKKFSKNDRHVLTMYSGGRFHQINEYLNGSMKDMENSNDVFDKANVKESKQLIEKLDKLFTNSDLSEPLVTYRGISNKTLSKYPELVNALDTPGSEIEFPCFSSTSALPFMANNFTTDENGRMGRLLELQLPSGTKALFIAEESVLPNEFEILVNRGTKFKVVETRYTDIIPPNNGSYKDRSAKHVKITTIKAIV